MTTNRNAEVGDRVRLISTSESHPTLKPGDEGVIRWVNDTGTIGVTWDGGSRLWLIPELDQWEIVVDEVRDEFQRDLEDLSSASVGPSHPRPIARESL